MKIIFLIISLFMLVNLQAQKSVFDTMFYNNRILWGDYYDNSSDIALDSIIVWDAIKELLFQWDRYSEECYNDSTSVWYDWYLWNGDTIKQWPSFDPGFMSGWLGTWPIYEHKQSSLEDFINWLKTQ